MEKKEVAQLLEGFSGVLIQCTIEIDYHLSEEVLGLSGESNNQTFNAYTPV